MFNKVSRILCLAATCSLVFLSKDKENNIAQPNNPDTAELSPGISAIVDHFTV